MESSTTSEGVMNEWQGPGFYPFVWKLVKANGAKAHENVLGVGVVWYISNETTFDKKLLSLDAGPRIDPREIKWPRKPNSYRVGKTRPRKIAVLEHLREVYTS
jgi:hypothetical protein